MGWIAFGLIVCGFFIASGLEYLGKCIVFASGSENREAWDEMKKKKEQGNDSA